MSEPNNDLTRKEQEEQLINELINEIDIAKVSDDVITLCERIVNSEKFNYHFEYDIEKHKIKFHNNIINFCNNKNHIHKLVQNLDDTETFNGLFQENTVFELNVTRYNMCDICIYSECIKAILILYIFLQERELLEQYLNKKEKPVGFYKFTWEPQDDLKECPEKIFNLAKYYADTNKVQLYPSLKDERLLIRCIGGCGVMRKIQTPQDVDTLPPDWFHLKRTTNVRCDKLCDDMFCRKAYCPFLIAARILYLRNNGRENEINEDREYYHQNEETILRKVQSNFENALAALHNKANNKDVLQKFEEFKDNVENLELLANAIGDNDDGLSFIIEREDGIDETRLISRISEVLTKSNKNLTLSQLYDNLKKNEQVEKDLLIITEVSSFINDEYGGITHKNKNKLINFLTEPQTNKRILIIGTKAEISDLYAMSPKIKYVYSDFTVIIKNLSNDQLFTLYKENLELLLLDKVTVNEAAFRKEFEEFVTNNRSMFPFKNEDFAKYLARYSNLCNELKLPPSVYKNQSLEESLQAIIGMETVKKKIKDFEKYAILLTKMKSLEMEAPAQNMHMLFTGNPGTGKTTIARIMAKLLYDIRIIRECKVTEVERKDLIGEYIGSTAPKTAKVINEAMGGVLFIDEAYSLTPKGEKDYGYEAIATLIKAMEDHKGEFVVIFAGYKREMEEFIETNPGIASRIGYKFHFDDYTAEELLQIYKLKLKNIGFEILQEASDAVYKIMQYFVNVENIGNGRFVDKVIQETLVKHAHQEIDDITKINVNSIPTIDEITNVLSVTTQILDPDCINEQSIRKTAIHEIGHAYAKYKLYKDPQIVKISINAQGVGTLGCVERKSDQKATHSKTELMKRIQVSLAGMANEELFNGEFENGNASDLQKATNIARNMVTQYGMSQIGFVQISDSSLNVEVHKEMNDILNQCYKDVKKTLEKDKSILEMLINYLLQHKEISGEEFIKQVQSIEEKQIIRKRAW